MEWVIQVKCKETSFFLKKFCWHHTPIQKTSKHWISYRSKLPWDHWKIRSAYRQNMQEIAEQDVLGLATTGLIFTGLHEGAQPGGLTPPGQTEPGIPYPVLSRWVLVGGELGGGNSLAARERGRRCGPGERLCGLCGLCCVFSWSVPLLFLFPLFAVLLNCPYPDPPVSACFLPFSSTPRRGEGRPRGAFVAGRSQTRTVWLKQCNNIGNIFYCCIIQLHLLLK